MSRPLVLSLFPGLGLLDMAFEDEGFCVVRGPDLIHGGDVRTFHPPAERFDGIIGGPPCQAFSTLRPLLDALGRPPRENLIPEYERCVAEAQPAWWVMENVPRAPLPAVAGYRVHAQLVRDVWVGGETQRCRRISFGTRDGRRLQVEQLALHPADARPAVIASGAQWVPVARGGSGKYKRSRHATRLTTRASLRENCRAQGLPADFFDRIQEYTRRPLYTVDGAQILIGNGVPLALGRAIARAVRAALEERAAAS